MARIPVPAAFAVVFSATLIPGPLAEEECGLAPKGFVAHYPVHGGPDSLVAGDFNCDGITDLAAGCGGSRGAATDISHVSILLGNGAGGLGDGTFSQPVDYTTNAPPGSVSLAAGDFNGDGIIDLAVASEAGGVSILLGNGAGGVGDGTFKDPAQYPADIEPSSVVTGDFNHDGVTDLAVGNKFSEDVSILLGNGAGGKGDGTFHAPAHYSTGGIEVFSLATGDFNGDGITDLAAAGDPGQGRVCILLGNGIGGVADGTFKMRALYEKCGSWSVTTGDFNGDGILDLAVAQWGGTISILLGKGAAGVGTGTFQAPVRLELSALWVASAEFNGDGIIDLVASTGSRVSVLLGKGAGGIGDGTFEAPAYYPVHSIVSSIVMGDFNGDKIMDFAVGNESTSDITILPGNGSGGIGDGTFQAPVHYPAHFEPLSVATGDFNGDKMTDLAVANAGSDDVSILLGIRTAGVGDGAFQAPAHYPAHDGPQSVVTGDFNGDGVTDLAVANLFSDDVSILLGNGTGGVGDGTFQAPAHYPAHNGPQCLATGDFNGDGITDLAVANPGSEDVSVLFGNGMDRIGDGTFGPPAHYPAHSLPAWIAAADFNADGINDLAVANIWSDDVSILLGNGAGGVGDGTFRAPAHYAAHDGPWGLATGDFNGDGITDISVANFDSNDVSILMGNGAGGMGNGTFQAPVHYLAHGHPYSLAAADFNGDGITDLAVANPGSRDVSILLGNGMDGVGDGTFQAPIHYPAHNQPFSLATGDFNFDGMIDLAVANSASNDVTILINTCGAVTGGLQRPGDGNQDGALDLSDAIWLLGHLFLGTAPELPCEGGAASSPGPGDLALADINGDGRIDLSDPVSLLGFLFLGSKPPVLGKDCLRIPGCPDQAGCR